MFLRLLLLCVIFVITFASHAKIPVNVALTSIQPPLVIDNEKKQGLIFDVVNALNDHQSVFVFNTRLYPAKRLLANFSDYDVHMVAFNHIDWGWKQRGGQPSVNLTDGRDLFFMLNDENTPVDHDKSSIGAVDGFHYAFAGFDSVQLAKMPNVMLTHDEDGVLKLVLHRRVGKGIASETYLNWVAKSRPEIYKKLEIDRAKPDHEYHRQFIVFKYSPITVDELNRLLVLLYEDGTLKTLYDKYGLIFPSPETVEDPT